MDQWGRGRIREGGGGYEMGRDRNGLASWCVGEVGTGIRV